MEYQERSGWRVEGSGHPPEGGEGPLRTLRRFDDQYKDFGKVKSSEQHFPLALLLHFSLGYIFFFYFSVSPRRRAASLPSLVLFPFRPRPGKPPSLCNPAAIVSAPRLSTTFFSRQQRLKTYRQKRSIEDEVYRAHLSAIRYPPSPSPSLSIQCNYSHLIGRLIGSKKHGQWTTQMTNNSA